MREFFWTLKQVADATSGALIGSGATTEDGIEVEKLAFTNVVTDHRQVAAPDDEASAVLFVAVIGVRFDGHQFIAQAIAAGAKAVMVSEVQKNCAVPQIVVTDTRLALGQFAHWHRLQMPLKAVVGITGSNGKTTIKTMVASLLNTLGSTLMTQGNFNNDFGVPRTLLELRPEHEYAVIEMGANHVGEIAYLTRLVAPDIALLNNAAEAHLEGFGSLNGVIRGKGEIFEGLTPSRATCVAIMNADSPGINTWRSKIQDLGIKDVIEFGRCSGNHRSAKQLCWQPDTLAEHSILKTQRNHFILQSTEITEGIPVAMPLMGDHNAYNACASTAVALRLGVSAAAVTQVFSTFTGVVGRLQQKMFDFGVVIDDSYNANPASVKAGIDVLVSLPGESVLCLGAMAELGERALEAHQNIAEYAAQKGVRALFFWQKNSAHGEDVVTRYRLAASNDDLLQGSAKAVSVEDSLEGFAQGYQDHEVLIQDLIQYIRGYSQSLQSSHREYSQRHAETYRPGENAFAKPGLLNILIKGSRSSQMEKVSKGLEQTFHQENR